jgi:glycosyltransferase involved in cell wall biosynthesis
MKIGIVIPTYKKRNGETPFLLSRALFSIKNQTYDNYKVFLIGDRYDDNFEFMQLANLIEEKKIYAENLLVAAEREKYEIGSEQLWSAGGVNATNYGINKSLENGINYICHLDHDDYWENNHLEVINKLLEHTNTSFVYTCANYTNTQLIPNVHTDGGVENSIPVPANLVHSTTCVDYTSIPLRYRDVFAETGTSYPADADMWQRIGNYINQNRLNSFLIKQLTCHHPTEKT